MTIIDNIDFEMSIHHLLCIFGMTLTLYYGNGANYVVMGIFIAEVPVPFYLIRHLLKKKELRYSRSYEVIEILYFSSFFLGRMVIAIPITYNTAMCSEMNLLARLISVAFYGVSCNLCYTQYFIAVCRYYEIKERNEKKLAFHWFKAIPSHVLEQCKFYQDKKKHLAKKND